MDIYQYIKTDHKKVDQLFSELQNTNDANRQAELFGVISGELIVHAESEEATFYRALEKLHQGEKQVHHGEHEHREIEDKINEIKNSKLASDIWHRKVVELKKLVEHHVKEEEENIFSEAKKVLSSADAHKLAEQMQAYKQTLMQNCAK